LRLNPNLQDPNKGTKIVLIFNEESYAYGSKFRIQLNVKASNTSDFVIFLTGSQPGESRTIYPGKVPCIGGGHWEEMEHVFNFNGVRGNLVLHLWLNGKTSAAALVDQLSSNN
jgi:hypothetical protein